MPFKEYIEKHIQAVNKDSAWTVLEIDYGKIVSVNTFAEDLSVELKDYK